MASFPPSRRSAWALPIALASVFVLSLFVPLAGAHPSSSAVVGQTRVHAGGGPSALVGHAGVAPATAAPRSAPGQVAAGGRLYQTTWTQPSGIVADNVLAFDSVTQTAYSVNRIAATVNSFWVQNGTVQHTYVVSHGFFNIFPTAIALDTVHHWVYVGVVSNLAAGGYVLVLDEATLSLVANVTTFAGVSSFQPAYAVFDAPTQQVFLENSSAGVTVLNTTNNTAWRTMSAPGCSFNCPTYGMTDVAPHGYVLVPTGAMVVPVINVHFDLFQGPVSGRAQFTAGVATYDNASDYLWIANVTGLANNVEAYNAFSGAYVGSVAGPRNVLAMAYDWVTGYLFVAVENSTPGASEQVYVIYASLGLLVSTYTNASASPNQAFSTLIVDNPSGFDRLITAGVYNATTAEFTLSVGPPYLTPFLSVSSFNTLQEGVAVDPSLGLYYVLTAAPDGIFAFNETTGLQQWFRNLDGIESYNLMFAVDPLQGYVYASGAFNGTLMVYSAATGAFVKASALGGLTTFASLADDPASHLLYIDGYAGGVPTVYVVNTTADSNAVTGTITTPGLYSPCAQTVQSSTRSLFLSNCQSTLQNITVISGRTNSITRVITQLGGTPTGLAFGGDGLLYVANPIGQNLTAVNTSTGRAVANLATPGFGGLKITAYPAQNWFYLTNDTTVNQVLLVNATSGSVAGRFDLPYVAYAVAFDPVHQTLIAPTLGTGVTLIATILPFPAPPSGLTVVGANNSISASWTAGVGSAGAPVTSYQVYTASAATGPWTAANMSTGTSATLSGLTDGTAYWVEVASVSLAGQGARSPASSATPSGVPYPPTSLVVSPNGSSSINAAWGAPAQTDGAPISNYTVWFSTATSGPWSSVSAGTSLHATLTHLASSKTYWVEVVAWNHNGGSHSSVQASASTAASSSSSASPLGGSTALIALLVILALIVIIAVVVMMRRRRPPAPVQPYTGMSGPGGPMPTPPPTPPGPSPQPPGWENPPGGGPPPGAM